VHPRAGLARRVAELADRVDGAAVHVADLGHDDRRPVAGGERVGEGVGAHRAARGDRHRHHRPGAEPEDPQRAVHGHVPLLAGQDADRRRADQAVPLDVVTDVGQHAMPRGGECGDVRHLAAGDERERHGRGQPQQVDQPCPGDLLERGGRRRRVREAGVLVPRGGQPVGGDPGRVRAAHHEREEARRVDRGQAGLGLADEVGDHVLHRDRPVAQRAGDLQLGR
jgi:hypothetical protein